MSNDEGRTITLNVPTMPQGRPAVRCYKRWFISISTSAESPLATTAGWRREIMRLHELVTGKEIWAGASITKQQDGRVVRINAPSPTGKRR
jgi:hypothetical protein